MFIHRYCSRILTACALAALPAVPALAQVSVASVDISNATRITLPPAGAGPVAFKTPDGKDGWVRRLSGETIPTPAYANGKIFTGTGMGASTFLAIDASTGKTIWEKHTTDNGPTSPVVTDKYVCYNTESCDTETRDTESGDLVWKEVTGGTLLTSPVLAGNILVIPHPTMQRTAHMADDAFRMMAVDVSTGQHRWDRNITADVLAAPVVAGGRVFFACIDGRLFCQTFGDEPGWHVVAKATSAPVVVGDKLAVTTEEAGSNGSAMVSIRRYDMKSGDLLDDKPLASTAVASAATGAQGRANWDYQGPKIAANENHLFFAPGVTVSSVDMADGKLLWRSVVSGRGLANTANALTPPALGRKNLYLGSNRGQILALAQADGTLAFAYDIGAPMASQPILAEGNLYVGTANGLLVCIKLQNPDASDWHGWGGDAQHNKVR